MDEERFHLSYDSPRLHLVSAFLALEPADHLINLARECGGGSISEEVQSFVMEHCIRNSVSCQFALLNAEVEKCYAPNHAFIQNFLKKLIISAESEGIEVHDDLYDHHAYLMSSKDDRSMVDKKTVCKSISFLFPEGSALNQTCSKFIVPLQCSLNMLEGDTGCSIWPSSLFLSEFILSHPNLFTKKFCFEVGSGVGLVGITLTYVDASRVILSDGDQLSLSNLQVNLEMNRLHTTVECKHLVWEATAKSELELYSPDIILGADVIYDPMCLVHLVRVLATLLKPKKPKSSSTKLTSSNGSDETRSEDSEGGGDNVTKDHTTEASKEKPDDAGHEMSIGVQLTWEAVNAMSNGVSMTREAPVAYIATIIRNPSTFDHFLKLADEANLAVLDITDVQKPSNLLPYMKTYDKAGIRLYQISFIYS